MSAPGISRGAGPGQGSSLKASTRRRLAALGLVVISLCGGALIGEGLVRLVTDVPVTPQMFVSDPVVDFRLKPNIRQRLTWPGDVRFSWTTNSRGYRSTPELAVPKPASTTRVLFIGDSFTFGQGVNDDQTFAAETGRRLKNLCPATRLEVVNAGVPGFSTSQELALLETEGLALEPDVVVLGFYANDPQDNLRRGVHFLQGDTLVRRPATARPRMYRMKKLIDKTPGYAWLAAHSQLFNLVRRAYVASTATGAEPAAFHGALTPDTAAARVSASAEVAEEYSWRLMRALLSRMSEAVRRVDSPLMILLIPDTTDVRLMGTQPAPDGRITAVGRMRTICLELGLACLDLVAWLKSSGRQIDETAMYIPQEFHFTPLGNALTGEFLAPRLRDALGCR